jgi:hypothetical protein
MITEARVAPGVRGVIRAERGETKRYSMATRSCGDGDALSGDCPSRKSSARRSPIGVSAVGR